MITKDDWNGIRGAIKKAKESVAQILKEFPEKKSEEVKDDSASKKGAETKAEQGVATKKPEGDTKKEEKK